MNIMKNRRNLCNWKEIVPKLTRCIITVVAIYCFCISQAFAQDNNQDETDYISMLASRKGDFSKMVENREIRALVVYSKTFYFIDQGQQRGISHDALMEFEKFVNKKLGLKTRQVKITFIPVRRDELIPKLVAGHGDLAIGNLTITSKRKELVDFSDPFLKGVKEVVVTGSGEKELLRSDDLSGREIYVRRSSSYYDSLVALNRLLEKTGREPMRLIPADESFEDEDLLEMINAGLISTIVMDSHKAGFWLKIFDNIKIHEKAFVRAGGEIGWAFRKKSPELKAIVNEFVRKNKKGTLIGNILFKRYLKDTKYVKNNIAKEELKKFEQMVALFKKYADQYDFDYLMMGAQAYQESGLDQGKRSPAGAIGVMQLLQSTARDKNINIPDIHVLEKNIHAGTKYMRFIYDRYFKNAPMDPVNKMLFSFAAYNAGPAKVQKIRKKTETIGLDPNAWFQNAEIAAAKIIGRETVQYVGNIYKYYIAYKLAQKRLREKRRLEK